MQTPEHEQVDLAPGYRRCAELITRIFYLSGAQGVIRSNPVARTFADIHTGRTHIANNPDKVGRNVGGVMLGAANTDTFI